jgi:hypothetical protein
MLILKESFNSLSCSFLSSTRCFLGILNACYYLIIKFSKKKKYRKDSRRTAAVKPRNSGKFKRKILKLRMLILHIKDEKI